MALSMTGDTCRPMFSLVLWFTFSLIASYWLVVGGCSLQVICLFILSFIQQHQFYQACIRVRCRHPWNITRLLGFSMSRLGLRVGCQHELRSLARGAVSSLREKARHRHGYSR